MAATLPARCSGPDMMQASNCTTPAAFGAPLNPTEELPRSDSGTQIPCSTASRIVPPARSLPRAASLAALPNPQVDTIRGAPAGLEAGLDSAPRTDDSVVPPAKLSEVRVMKRRLVMPMGKE